MLIIGGVVLLLIDRFAPFPTRKDVMALPLGTSFAIGLFQCLALVPGVSRSGATIVGAMLMGVEKRVAAEFSFLLAIPVMAGAFTFDAWKSRHELNTGHIELVAVGFVVSFVVALFVIRGMLAIVTRRGYAPFGWLRIAIGAGGLVRSIYAKAFGWRTSGSDRGQLAVFLVGVLAALAVAVEVARQHRLQRRRRDPQVDEARMGAGGDVVGLQQDDLVGGDRGCDQETAQLSRRAHQRGHRPRCRGSRMRRLPISASISSISWRKL